LNQGTQESGNEIQDQGKSFSIRPEAGILNPESGSLGMISTKAIIYAKRFD
jgi:hypothetical protein